MCYYDQYKMACGCSKWGHFRQHCTKEHRIGDTCGMRLVMEMYAMPEKCKICVKMESSWKRIKEQERIRKWKTETGKGAANEATSDTVKNLLNELKDPVEINNESPVDVDGELRSGNDQGEKDNRAQKGSHFESYRYQLSLPPLPVWMETPAELRNRAPPKAKNNETIGQGQSFLISQGPSNPPLSGSLWGQNSATKVGLEPEMESSVRSGFGEVLSNPGSAPEANDTQEDLSDASSVGSVDSIFSNFTASTMSSVGAGPESDESLYILLTGDELNVIYAQIIESMSIKQFEGALRHSLVVFSINLLKEASDQKEKYAAKVVRYRARNLAHLISRKMSIREQKLPKEVEVSDEEQMSDDEENDLEDYDGVDDTDVQALERFALRSNAFRDFKARLVELILPIREAKWQQNQEVEVAEIVGEKPLAGDVPWERTVDVAWKCSCGRLFQERVIEYNKGSAHNLADSIDTRAPIDLERQAGSESCAESSTSNGSSPPNEPCQQTSEARNSIRVGVKEQSALWDSASPVRKQFILLCRDRGNATSLYHADVSKTFCDYYLYHVLHAQFYGRLKGFWRWLVLSEIFAVEFVKFHLYWATNVSIEEKDFGGLPPHPSEDYSYTADTKPPVLKTALRHFIEHPSHAPKHPRHRPRIPKKVGEPLLIDKYLDAPEGYGLYIQERICWRKVFIIEAVFSTACMIFAIAWCIKNSGGIQDGFAIAGTGIAYATIILGASQAVAQSHWR